MPKRALPSAPEPSWSVPFLAAYWQLTPDFIRREIKAGRFPGAWQAGSDWRIPISAINSYAAARRIHGTEAAA